MDEKTNERLPTEKTLIENMYRYEEGKSPVQIWSDELFWPHACITFSGEGETDSPIEHASEYDGELLDLRVSHSQLLEKIKKESFVLTDFDYKDGALIVGYVRDVGKAVKKVLIAEYVGRLECRDTFRFSRRFNEYRRVHAPYSEVMKILKGVEGEWKFERDVDEEDGIITEYYFKEYNGRVRGIGFVYAEKPNFDIRFKKR